MKFRRFPWAFTDFKSAVIQFVTCQTLIKSRVVEMLAILDT